MNFTSNTSPSKLGLHHLGQAKRITYLNLFGSSYNIEPRYLPLTTGGRVNSRQGQGGPTDRTV